MAMERRTDIVLDMLKLDSLKEALRYAVANGALLTYEDYLAVKRNASLTPEQEDALFIYVGDRFKTNNMRWDEIVMDHMENANSAKIKSTWNSYLVNVDVFIAFEESQDDILVGLFVTTKGQINPNMSYTMWCTSIPK